MTKLLALFAMTVALVGVLACEAWGTSLFLSCDIPGTVNNQPDNLQRLIIGPVNTDPFENNAVFFYISGLDALATPIYGSGFFGPRGVAIAYSDAGQPAGQVGIFVRHRRGECPNHNLNLCAGSVIDVGSSGIFTAVWNFSIVNCQRIPEIPAP